MDTEGSRTQLSWAGVGKTKRKRGEWGGGKLKLVESREGSVQGRGREELGG